jgi:hypothetical protein
MSLKNKVFKNKLTGDTFTIVDQYQNVAITSNKEKVNTSLLQNNNIFEEVVSGTINESFTRKTDDPIDPRNFFDNQRTYDVFAEKIKNVDMSNIKDEQFTNDSTMNLAGNFRPSNDESAVIMSDPEYEIEELKRKYGAVSVDDSLRKQNEVFSKILEPNENQQQDPYVPVQLSEQQNNRQNIMNIQQNEPPIQRIEVQDPVIGMFKNVKRNTDFKINLKIDGKIPRLDFIEMMEDSYEVSIIEYLADEFTNNLLKDPSIIRNKIINEIKSQIEKKNSPSDKKEVMKSSTDVNPQITDSVTTEKPKTVRKSSKVSVKKESTQ